MKTKLIGLGLVLAATALIGGTAMAHDDPNATPVQKARDANFHKMGKAAKAMFDSAKSGNPDIAVFKANAPIIDELAPKLVSWFPAGSGPEAGSTHALPAVWQKPEEFKKDADALATAAKALNAAAQSGDIKATVAALPSVGGACQTCHKAFKARDEH